MQILIRDLYGHSDAIDVTVIIEEMITIPTDFPLCYTENGVVTQGFGQD